MLQLREKTITTSPTTETVTVVIGILHAREEVECWLMLNLTAEASMFVEGLIFSPGDEEALRTKSRVFGIQIFFFLPASQRLTRGP